MQLDGSVTTANSSTSNFVVQNASVTFKGDGVDKASAPYDRNHGTGVIKLVEGAEVIFDGPGIDTVLADADAGQFGIAAFDNAKVTFKSGQFKAGWFAYAGNGNSGNATEVHIEGGRFISEYDYACYFPDAGKRYISGDAYIDGLTGAVAVNNGELYISGNPTITTKGAASAIQATYSDGTATMETENAALNLNAKYGDVICRISGGKFIGGSGVAIATGATHSIDLKISGGAFSQPITNSDWLEDGYVCKSEANSEGLYEVVKSDTAVG